MVHEFGFAVKKIIEGSFGDIGFFRELVDVHAGKSVLLQHHKPLIKQLKPEKGPVFLCKYLWHILPSFPKNQKQNDFENIESHFKLIILETIKNFKEGVMLNKVRLTDTEMREFAEVFAYYDYGNEEIGMVPYYPGYPDRTSLVNYLVAMIKTANEYNGIYATSDNKEGIIILTDTTHPYPGIAMIKMLWRMAGALGFKNFSDIIKKFQAGGASLEKTYRDSKKQFIQIELLAVKKEYQGKGYMRPLVETAFEVAKQGNLPVIVSTDARLKKDKYEHIGMKHVNTRTLGEKSFMYDLVREA